MLSFTNLALRRGPNLLFEDVSFVNGIKNEKQYALYRDLIKEEVEELNAAIKENDEVEQLDALIDILVVTIGAINSMGADDEGAWQ